MALSTSTTMADAAIEIVDQTFLFELEEYAVADQFVSMAEKDDYGVYKVPIYDNLGAAASAKGENPLLAAELSAQGVSNVEFTPVKEADGLGYTEEADIVTGGQIKLAVAKNTGKAAGLTRGLRAVTALNANLLTAGGFCIQANDELARNTSAVAAVEVTATDVATVDLFGAAWTHLVGQFASTFAGGAYFALAHIKVIGDLKKDAKWINAKQYADPNALITGEIGMLDGIRYIHNPQATVAADGAAGANVYRTHVIGENALGLGENREPLMIAGNIPTDLVNSEWYSAYKMYIQYKIVQRLAMVTVLSA